MCNTYYNKSFIFFREKNLFKKPCMFHCSWRVVAISLTFLTIVLSSVIVYFGGKSLLGLLGKINHIEMQ